MAQTDDFATLMSKVPTEDDSRLIAFAKDMRGHIAKGKQQFDA
jgi:hypothetical protein